MILAVVPLSFLGDNFFVSTVYAQPAQRGEIPQEREIHNTFGTTGGKATILDATNPLELMNILRESQSMQNATSPSDAIDDALKALDTIELERTSVETVDSL